MHAGRKHAQETLLQNKLLIVRTVWQQFLPANAEYCKSIRHSAGALWCACASYSLALPGAQGNALDLDPVHEHPEVERELGVGRL